MQILFGLIDMVNVTFDAYNGVSMKLFEYEIIAPLIYEEKERRSNN